MWLCAFLYVQFILDFIYRQMGQLETNFDEVSEVYWHRNSPFWLSTALRIVPIEGWNDNYYYYYFPAIVLIVKKTGIINFIKIIVFSLFRKFSLDLLKEPFEVTFLIIYLVFYALFCRGLPMYSYTYSLHLEC